MKARIICIAVTVLMLVHPSADAQPSLTGKYSMQAGETSLELEFSQQGTALTGSLTSNTGASFALDGEVENGIGYGTCTGPEGTVYFEAYVEGNDLTLGLIEMDQFNMPDYDRAQYLQFVRSAGGTAGSSANAVRDAPGPGHAGSQGAAANRQTPSSSQGLTNQQLQSQSQDYAEQGAPAGTPGRSNIGNDEVGDPSWGFKFVPPEGWVHQQSAEGILLGHNSIAGMILVLPHLSENMQQLQMEMQQGIREEGSYLALSGSLQTIRKNAMGGDYTGVMDGKQVRARGFGVLSPYGSGACIIAVSTPEAFSQDLLNASESIVENMQYFEVDVTGLMRHFAGNWSHFTSNTSTWICFCPDGSYSEQYEAAYSGDFVDGAGNYEGGWNAAGQDGSRGRWTVRGNRDSGTIIVSLNNGNEIYYEYRVHVENGQKYYAEYYFNGDFYMKKTD